MSEENIKIFFFLGYQIQLCFLKKTILDLFCLFGQARTITKKTEMTAKKGEEEEEFILNQKQNES